MAATRPSQCGASRHTFVPGAKYLEPRTGFFVSPTTFSSTTRAVRYQIHLGVRGTQQAPAQARDRSPLCSHHPTPASSVHQRACRTSRSRLQRERSHTHRRSRGFGRRPTISSGGLGASIAAPNLAGNIRPLPMDGPILLAKQSIAKIAQSMCKPLVALRIQKRLALPGPVRAGREWMARHVCAGSCLVPADAR